MQRPNVVLLVADDLPRNILGSYGSEHGLLPHLDSLAQGGMTFTNAFTVAPLCTPSRYALLTGTYASRGARDRSEAQENVQLSGRLAGERVPARQVDFQVFLSHHGKGEPTFTMARMLRGRGYYTGMIGKYHVGHSLQAADCGGERGSGTGGGTFVRASLLADASERAAHSCRTIGNQTCLSASIRRHAGFDHVADIYYDNDGLTFYAHQPEWMTHEALKFVRAARKRQLPFFLWMAPSLTHSPSDVSRQLTSEPRAAPAGCSAASDEMAQSEVAASFLALARRVRSSVLQRLARASVLCRKNATDWRICPDEKLPRSTSLIHPQPWLPPEWFQGDGPAGAGRRAGLATSVALAAWLDASLAPLFRELQVGSNGSVSAPHATSQPTIFIFTSDHGPYFAGKGHAYEAGIRVPLVARWLGVQTTSSVVETRISHLDLLPSFAAMVGYKVPAQSCDGRVVPELLLSKQVIQKASPPPLFVEVGFSRAVVVDHFKLILYLLPPSADADVANCRSIHGIKLPKPGTNATAVISEGTKIKFIYDVRERHPVHHCDRVQLYDLHLDPAEQRNIAPLHSERVEAMRRLILEHVSTVEGPRKNPLGMTNAGVPLVTHNMSSSPLQLRRANSTPRSWCQNCHPSTECTAWPDESTSAPEAISLDQRTRQMIENYADALINGLRGNASSRAIADMIHMKRGEPYAPRDKCVLLRAEDGRIFIDFLDTNYGRQQDFSIASCFPSKKGNYLRSRLHIALRLILRALRRVEQLPAFEIGFCPDDCSPALNANENSVLPILTSVSCAGRSSLPFVAWTVNSNRAPDLSEWDSFIDGWAKRARTVPWQDRAAKAVFRGHLRPFTVCGGWPGERPSYNQGINASNWHGLGRSAIWGARVAHPELLDVNFDNRAEMAGLWQLRASEAGAFDEPTSMSMEEQARRFRYTIHPEGQCGFADRLKSLMALPMLIFKQANPCTEWYEAMLTAGEHFVPVDGNYANLSLAIAWARAHDTHAQQVAERGHQRIRQVVSVPGIYAYVDRLIERYARAYLNTGPNAVGKYTHEFSCTYGGSTTRCSVSLISK